MKKLQKLPRISTIIAIFWANNFVSPLPQFQSQIPNGALVPFPCSRSDTWPGVGHELIGGQGPLNAFGRDFLANGKKYDKTLCRLDSDGDGRTNGEELGDPDCVWVRNALPATQDISLLSHPGICEPVDSPHCAGKNYFLRGVDQCSYLFVNRILTNWCPAIRQPGVRSLTLRFEDETRPLPLYENGEIMEIFYSCKQFMLPTDQDYHIIAWEAIISNPEIVQSINVFVCDTFGQQAALDSSRLYKKPSECSRLPKECYSNTIRWTLGMTDRCYNNDCGLEMGTYKRAILQIRYNTFLFNNSTRNFTDSSGLKIYYTPDRRPFDIGTLQIGQMDIAIPPRSRQMTRVIGKTFQSSQCSWRTLAPYQAYFITSVLVHMNKLGSHAKLTLKKRNGRVITIVDDDVSFLAPKVQFWSNSSQAIVLEPGDNIEIECVYKSIEQDRWTYFGLNATDEICTADFDVHPRPQNRNALTIDSLGKFDICSMNESIVDGCSIVLFQENLTLWENSTEGGLMTYCNDPELGYPAFSCSYACYMYLNSKQLLGSPCMKGATFHLAASYIISNAIEDIYRIRSQAERCSAAKVLPKMSAKDRIIAEAMASRKVFDEFGQSPAAQHLASIALIDNNNNNSNGRNNINTQKIANKANRLLLFYCDSVTLLFATITITLIVSDWQKK